MIDSNLSKFDKASDLILLNAKTGKCHRYKEYEIKPIFTKKVFVSNLITVFDLLLKKITKQVPNTTIAEKIEGLGMFSSNKKKYKIIKINPKVGKKYFFFILILALKCKYAITEPHNSSHNRVGKI